tara:strand:- start:261 stop:2093 length:1833 start_codon:yes stop_codon:yes gene_type:complete
MNLTIGQLSSLIREEIKTFISESTSAQTSPYANEMIQAIRELDFTDIEYVSSGQFGDVYKGKWQREGGAPRAIKVLSYDEIGKKEAYLYRRVSDGRSKSDAIKKHFPKVDMVRRSTDGDYVLIVMELLESDPNVKSVIEDIFGYREVGTRTDLPLQDLDIFKDIGYRANAMVVDTKSRANILKDMIYGYPSEVKDKMSKSIMGMNFDSTIFPRKKFDTLKRRIAFRKHPIWDSLDVAEEDLSKTGEAALSFLFYFVAYSIKFIKEEEQNMSETDVLYKLKIPLEYFIDAYRDYTPVGIGGINFPGAPKETEGLGYPGAKSLLQAINDMEKIVGLEARDMHDRNVLVRPSTKDIVIVDVGMFRSVSRGAPSYEEDVTIIEKKKWSKSERSKRKKNCSNPKGFTMKQFCKNQRTRSKKGQRKNEEIEEVYSDKQRRYMCAMSRQGADRPEGLSKAEAEEMCKGPMKKEGLDERCQKGYKTHPTRKTKKMFGRTYRNCIKAEEGKDPKKGTGKKPKGSGRRLYTDEDPSDTVSVSFKSVSAIQKTLAKKSFKAKSHKRQSQIINLIHQRVRAAYRNAKDPKTKARLKKAYDYAKKRKESSKRKTLRMRKQKKR